MSYTRLDNVKDEMKGEEAYKEAKTERQLMRYIRTVTNRIRMYYEFEPYYATEKFTPSRMNVNSVEALFTLNKLLLEVKSIVLGGVTVTYGTDVVSEPENGQTPIRVLRLAAPHAGPVHSWYPDNTTPDTWINSIAITGFWGMRQFYTDLGFFDSGIVCPILTATQSTFIVSDVDGTDMYGRTPMFSPGNLIRVEDELIELTTVNITTNTLGGIRGSRGTAKAAHAAGKAILIFEPEEDIVNMATRQVGLLYARRGAYEQVSVYPDGYSVTYPSDLLAEIRATVQRFGYV